MRIKKIKPKKLLIATKPYSTLRELIFRLIATVAFARECIKIIGTAPSETSKEKTTGEIVSGAWYFDQEVITLNTIENHAYFQAGESPDLVKSLCNSSGNKVHLCSHTRKNLVISYNCNGMLAYSGGKQFDKHISQGQSPRTSSSLQVQTLQSAIIAYQRNATNYFHFLTEVVISLIAHLDLIRANQDQTLVLPNISIADEAMALLEIKNKTIKLGYQGILVCKNSTTLDLIPSGFASPIYLEKLRKLAHKYASSNGLKNQEKVIFLDRGKSSRRRLANASKVFTLIREYFPQAIHLETDLMPLKDQISSFENAVIVITPQGAHSINTIWSKKLKYYIEISPNQDKSITHYAEMLGAKVELVKSQYHNPNDFSSSHDCDLNCLDELLKRLQF